MEEKYYISVGEPWDFEGPDGKNVINGRILKQVSERCVLFKANAEQAFGNVAGDVFVLFPRYREDTFANPPKYITIAGCLLLDGWNENMNDKELELHSEYVLIGGLNKER